MSIGVHREVCHWKNIFYGIDVEFVVFILGLFNAFDENQDGHIDFRELACGISKCCRGSNAERQKCE